MKLRLPKPGEPLFVTIIDDVDGEGIDVAWHDTQEIAEAHLNTQYDGIVSDGEPGGETYGPGERPNASLEVVQVLLCRVLVRTLV